MATVSIGTTTWAVTLASSAAELTAGLSGVASIDAQTGMLFDMATEQSAISINMASMLFNLDIVFISAGGVVVGVLRNVAPGDEVAFDASGGLGARYFMEVNAGEAVDVNVGDIAAISITEQQTTGLDMSFLMSMVVIVMMAGVMGPMMEDMK